ncbi:hypothetical protein K7W42_09990 [Deinococcus sp. HMF7604]|uniref:hypothetical protein n=1 Tax=Deinococcus betulae TaxID=2873312 RepID=UPI001CCE38B4|nr:hypothetical protein [Deinococcus betulae]MBZ9751194.1 hypothetical protein [Deinococcus betulae]
MTITCQPPALADVPLLTGWLPAPHIWVSWDDSARRGRRAGSLFPLGRDVPDLIEWAEGQPMGFSQTQQIQPDHAFVPWASQDGKRWGLALR